MRTPEMLKMLEKYKDSHYVERKQLKTNPEINDELYHRRQEEADYKATLNVNNKFYGGDPENPMYHDPNTPIITPSELALRGKPVIKKPNNLDYTPPTIAVRTSNDKLKEYLRWKNEDRSHVSRVSKKSTKSRNSKSMIAPSNHVSEINSHASRKLPPLKK